MRINRFAIQLVCYFGFLNISIGVLGCQCSSGAGGEGGGGVPAEVVRASRAPDESERLINDLRQSNNRDCNVVLETFITRQLWRSHVDNRFLETIPRYVAHPPSIDLDK